MSSQRTGRRGWLGALLPTAADAALSFAEPLPSAKARRRPPGALPEERFLVTCDACSACIDACPHGAVLRYAPSAGDVAGTPVMRPDTHPCHMCEGFPCASACEPGALVPPSTSLVVLGRARIREDRCFAFRGPECGACVGLCPEGLGAIKLAGTRPVLERERCIGCGLCIAACPTRPAAIELEPL